MPVRRTVYCPVCGSPFDVTIADDGRLRSLGCTYQDRRPDHAPITEAQIITALIARRTSRPTRARPVH
jgi:hypothetical protein